MIYTYQTTITVRVIMADEGELWDDGEPAHWETPAAQEESAREWAEQAVPLTEDYAESWVTVDAPPLRLVSAASEEQPRG